MQESTCIIATGSINTRPGTGTKEDIKILLLSRLSVHVAVLLPIFSSCHSSSVSLSATLGLQQALSEVKVKIG